MQCIHVVTHVEQSQLLMSQFKNRPQNVGTTDTAQHLKYIEPEPRAESMFTHGCTAAYIDDLEFDNKLHSYWQK